MRHHGLYRAKKLRCDAMPLKALTRLYLSCLPCLLLDSGWREVGPGKVKGLAMRVNNFVLVAAKAAVREITLHDPSIRSRHELHSKSNRQTRFHHSRSLPTPAPSPAPPPPGAKPLDCRRHLL